MTPPRNWRDHFSRAERLIIALAEVFAALATLVRASHGFRAALHPKPPQAADKSP